MITFSSARAAGKVCGRIRVLSPVPCHDNPVAHKDAAHWHLTHPERYLCLAHGKLHEFHICLIRPSRPDRGLDLHRCSLIIHCARMHTQLRIRPDCQQKDVSGVGQCTHGTHLTARGQEMPVAMRGLGERVQRSAAGGLTVSLKIKVVGRRPQ
jgi:hypothetical protein